MKSTEGEEQLSKPFYSPASREGMAIEHENLALTFAPELYYTDSLNPFEDTNPEDMEGLYWRSVEGGEKTDFCIQYIAFFTYQRWVPSILDKFPGKVPGEHPNDYVPIFLYFKDETPVKAVFDICHYEAIGNIAASSPLFPLDRRLRFHVKNFYRGLFPLKEVGHYKRLKKSPIHLDQEHLTYWWNGRTHAGSYDDKARLIIVEKLNNPFQEIVTFRDQGSKLGVLFDWIFRTKMEGLTVTRTPSREEVRFDEKKLVSPEENERIRAEFSKEDIEETVRFVDKNIFDNPEITNLLTL